MAKKMHDLTLEELKASEKAHKKILPIYGVIVAMLVVAGIVLTIKDGAGAFTFIPIVFLSIFFSTYASFKHVQKEIAAREQQ